MSLPYKATPAAEQERDRKIKAAWEAYINTIRPARDVYAASIEPLWNEYERVCEEAEDVYNRARDAAWAE